MYGVALEIPPMKAWKLPKGKEHMRKEVCESGDYFGQIKKDGYYYAFEKDAEGNCFLFSREVSTKTGHLTEKSANVPHIIDFLNKRLPNGTIIIGEVYYPNKTSKEVTKVMGCLPDKAVARQTGNDPEMDLGLIHFYMHDILMYDGLSYVEAVNNFDRYLQLLRVLETHSLKEESFMEVADAQCKYLEQMIDDAIESGEEGVVLKKMNGLFCPDKKPAWNWIKFKVEDDHDVVCTGFGAPRMYYDGKELDTWKYWVNQDGTRFLRPDEGMDDTQFMLSIGFKPVTKPYFNGWVGTMYIGVTNGERIIEIGRVASGLTDEDLEAIAKDRDSFLMRPLAVKAMMTGENALRHPVFERWRDDLNVSDCTYDKIFS
jgi:ATP-dependent DNA ligase